MERRDSGAGDRRLVRGLLPTRQPSSPAAPATTGPAPSSQARRRRTDDRRLDSRPGSGTTDGQPGPISPRAAQTAEGTGPGRPAGAGPRRPDPDVGNGPRRTGLPRWRGSGTGATDGPPAAAGRHPSWWPRPTRPASHGLSAGVSGLLGLITLCLVLAAVILGLSWLVGGLDVMALGAVLGVWALCVAARVILGRPGTDWTVPTLDQVVAAGLAGPDECRSPQRRRRGRGWRVSPPDPAAGPPEPAVPSGCGPAAVPAVARSAGTEPDEPRTARPTGGSVSTRADTDGNRNSPRMTG
ncbi:hypothetical protein [Pseudofrankia sp. DC12]|uniref:hypothetical protein n=1 Tax=Pseudofrankia sp. DC12 TaxID=683315 RepID=UPI0005F80AB0|nr:hypothetical protein [Pseudofrankia sp. DC12]